MKKIFGFSLVEIVVALIIISVIAAALAPIITKKMKSNHASIIGGSGGTAVSDITTECSNNPNFGPDCKLCTSQYCIDCGLTGCSTGQYADTKRCECKSCTATFGNLCAECNSKGCVRCSSAAYYINNGTCVSCPSGSYCDGVNIYATCPGAGYYCDSTGIHKCSEKYSSNCATCTSSACTSCLSKYYLSGKNCLECSAGCNKCTSGSYCTKCSTYYYLNSTTHACDSCSDVLTGCMRCSSKSKCSVCSGGYYLNTTNKCSVCSVSNCIKCIDGRDASSPACELCSAGYYINTSGTCSSCASKFGSNCVTCNANQCTSCNQNYHIEDPSANPACESDDKQFNCSDSNFMKIGNLCITRRNMGDSGTLSIPSNIRIAQAGSGEICYAQSEKCCWRGPTANQSYCDSANGNYSGCNRTVCNWEAADEICKNFNYAGKKWRLPTKEELTDLGYYYSIGIGADGLMFCDYFDGHNSARCRDAVSCPGAQSETCQPRVVWSGSENTSLEAYVVHLRDGIWTNNQIMQKANPYSVRCVTDEL